MREQQNQMLTRNTTLENTPGSLPTGVDYHEQKKLSYLSAMHFRW